MTHGSLFSGIGGFELAAEWCGFENVFSCEQNPFGQRVLKHYWPNADHHDDVKTFPSSNYTGRIDILTGGFPCQPYSVAGKRLGKDDDRHLWPFMLDIIREVAPTYVVGENVRGLVNWSDGMVFEEVCADLEVEGYDVQPFILPAAGVGAPHRRDRVWFVAYTNNRRAGREVQARRDEPAGLGQDAADTKRNGLEHGTERGGFESREGEARERIAGHVAATGKERNAADTESIRSKQQRIPESRQEEPHGRNSRAVPPSFEQFPTFAPICGGDDGLPSELDGITFPKWRAESIKAYGNAIVPQVALQIFETIKQMEQ